MQNAVQNQIQTILDDATPEELVDMAASAFSRWCSRSGIDDVSATKFVRELVDAQVAKDCQLALISALDGYHSPLWVRRR